MDKGTVEQGQGGGKKTGQTAPPQGCKHTGHAPRGAQAGASIRQGPNTCVPCGRSCMANNPTAQACCRCCRHCLQAFSRAGRHMHPVRPRSGVLKVTTTSLGHAPAVAGPEAAGSLDAAAAHLLCKCQGLVQALADDLHAPTQAEACIADTGRCGAAAGAGRALYGCSSRGSFAIPSDLGCELRLVLPIAPAGAAPWLHSDH